MSYNFGVSFNCLVIHPDKKGEEGNDEVGGIDHDFDISYVSDDSDKLIAHILSTYPNSIVDYYHEFVGREVQEEVGGEVIGVFFEQDMNEDDFLLAVIFKDPVTPEVI